MLKKYEIECPSCDASYTISHGMDEKTFRLKGCPFCLEEILDEDSVNELEWDEDEEDWIVPDE